MNTFRVMWFFECDHNMILAKMNNDVSIHTENKNIK